ncbi:WbqC family protein [Flavobacteriaceae bacterium AH-315-B10]|nr:WbqC family protein [Flavobacteriaceae bacterium AH-315-B10]
MSVLLHPTYFPNISHCVGIANAQSILFEVEDSYQKQTYRNRTTIYAANGALILSIPVVFTQKNRQKFRDVKIANDANWQSQHWKSLQSAYRTSPFFEFYEDELKPLFTKKEANLLDFNFKCLEVIFDCLQLDSTFTKTESYQKIIEDKTDLRHLVNTKQEQVQQFSNYTQVFNNKHGFLNNLSILDLLFNEGTNALSYLQSQKLIV